MFWRTSRKTDSCKEVQRLLILHLHQESERITLHPELKFAKHRSHSLATSNHQTLVTIYGHAQSDGSIEKGIGVMSCITIIVTLLSFIVL